MAPKSNFPPLLAGLCSPPAPPQVAAQVTDVTDEHIVQWVRGLQNTPLPQLRSPAFSLRETLSELVGDGSLRDFQLKLLQKIAALSSALRDLAETQRQPILAQLQEQSPLLYAILRFQDDRVTGAAMMRFQAIKQALGDYDESKVSLNKALSAIDDRFKSEAASAMQMQEAVMGRRLKIDKPATEETEK